ncbi:MAG: glycosyltransferase family 2 protein [Dehalococcoidia bacterium]|nr:glycosyltransferase family 2 protein [Dehalococcoidia bacterium]
MSVKPTEQRAVALSIVIPVFNEEDNLRPLHEKLVEVCLRVGVSFEVIYVDDGSKDGSLTVLEALATNDAHVKVIQLRRNFGQTAAIAAGVDASQGEVVILMDADMQNDPEDIPRLLAKIQEGYDVVSGWRRNRKDRFLTRRLPSNMANKLISVVSGVRLHDYGCTLKAYRREVIQGIRFYGEMHRLIPAYAAWMGASITEIEVTHHPRLHGRSKYGLSRTIKVMLDLITVKFLSSFATKPIYVFGMAGLLMLAAGALVGAIVLAQKFFADVFVHRNPLLLLAVFLFILGVQLIMMGLLAEINIRTYYESQNKPIYSVRRVISQKEP